MLIESNGIKIGKYFIPHSNLIKVKLFWFIYLAVPTILNSKWNL